MFISWMLITLSFKKSLIVGQFQGNYLKTVHSFEPNLREICIWLKDSLFSKTKAVYRQDSQKLI